MGTFWAFAWDCRGHGRSPGERGYANEFYDHVRDLETFVRFVSKEHDIPVENMALVANSIGSVTAAAWVHDYAPRVRVMVLAAPGLRVRLYVPLAIPGLRLLQRIKGKAFISSYVKSKMLTHDEEQMRKYDEDELITKNIAVNILLGLHDLATRIMADAGAIVVPTLVLSAGSDWVVKNSAQRKFYERLSSSMKDLELYPGFFHAILYEADRAKPIAKARKFIEEAFEQEVDRSFLLSADEVGYTKEEYQRLRVPAAPLKAAYYGLQKFAMWTIGRLSEGVRLGWRTGFNSGESLDYVYQNESHGTTVLGRLIDTSYLNAVGWRAMRERERALEACLTETVAAVAASGQPVRILDIAAGGGRYVLDTLRENPNVDISAVLRDRDPAALVAAQKLAERMALANVTFEEGDAFDTASLLAIEPQPNIAIVSGLYELFPENARILASLEGLAGLIPPGGYLIYTCQPWHPQLEMIARTCVDMSGEPWIMRRRTQAEIDELVRSVGFEKSAMRIDSYGISTVTVAQRRVSA